MKTKSLFASALAIGAILSVFPARGAAGTPKSSAPRISWQQIFTGPNPPDYFSAVWADGADGDRPVPGDYAGSGIREPSDPPAPFGVSGEPARRTIPVRPGIYLPVRPPGLLA